MVDVILSDHGEYRVRKRMGIPKRTVEKLAQAALTDGLQRRDFTGSMRRYLDGLYLKDGKTKPDIRVHKQFIFLFKDGVLITSWHLPQKYVRVSLAVERKKNQCTNTKPKS